jgi:hypothetical protein
MTTPVISAGNLVVGEKDGFATFRVTLSAPSASAVSAFAADTALVLAHLDCDDKSNEIPAVKTLLGTLGLAGAVVTVDAMHCQKKPLSKLPRAAFI